MGSGVIERKAGIIRYWERAWFRHHSTRLRLASVSNESVWPISCMWIQIDPFCMQTIGGEWPLHCATADPVMWQQTIKFCEGKWGADCGRPLSFVFCDVAMETNKIAFTFTRDKTRQNFVLHTDHINAFIKAVLSCCVSPLFLDLLKTLSQLHRFIYRIESEHGSEWWIQKEAIVSHVKVKKR
jgi:hypothetical protein